jgi:hypothetical protein
MEDLLHDFWMNPTPKEDAPAAETRQTPPRAEGSMPRAAEGSISNPPADHKLFTTKYDNIDQLEADLTQWSASVGFASTSRPHLDRAGEVDRAGPLDPAHRFAVGGDRPDCRRL